jgi:hypothetical protein
MMAAASMPDKSGTGMASLFIIVLHNGVVAEQGTHDELLTLGGTYSCLYWASPAAPAELRVAQHPQLTGANLAWRAH